MTSPLQAWAARFAAAPPGVGLREEPFGTQVAVRLDPDGPAAARVAERLGVALPSVASTWLGNAAATAIWLGPDEWLVTSSALAPAHLEADLRAAIGPDHGSVVDVSAQRTTVRLRGRHANELLAGGCAIDLHPAAFRSGSAAQTTLGRAGIVLLALDDAGSDYRVLVRSSFAGYLAAWLLDAAVEFTGG